MSGCVVIDESGERGRNNGRMKVSAVKDGWY